jgi:hypothetical protein
MKLLKREPLCKNWDEVDDDSGRCFEYCKAVSKMTHCCGVREQCVHGKFTTGDVLKDFVLMGERKKK